MATITLANAQIGGNIQALNPLTEGFNVTVNAHVNFEDDEATRQAKQEGITRQIVAHEATFGEARGRLASEFNVKLSQMETFVTDWNAAQETPEEPAL